MTPIPEIASLGSAFLRFFTGFDGNPAFLRVFAMAHSASSSGFGGT
jgi:hypothetical protein